MTKTVQSVFAPVEPKPKKKKSRRNPLYEPQDPVKSVHILSMGAGVQTTAMLLKYGKTGRYDYIVFADTGSEMPGTYEYIKKYLKPYAAECGIPWVTVGYLNGESIYDFYMANEALPLKMTRECTREFKIRPINRFARSLGCTESNPMIEDLGISWDEAKRANFSRDEPYIAKEFPFVDDRVTREQCYKMITDHGWPVPVKSGCYFCPFKTRSYFRQLAKEQPDLFARAMMLEKNDRKYPNFPLDGRAPLQNILDNAELDLKQVKDTPEESCMSGSCGK